MVNNYSISGQSVMFLSFCYCTQTRRKNICSFDQEEIDIKSKSITVVVIPTTREVAIKNCFFKFIHVDIATVFDIDELSRKYDKIVFVLKIPSGYGGGAVHGQKCVVIH